MTALRQPEKDLPRCPTAAEVQLPMFERYPTACSNIGTLKRWPIRFKLRPIRLYGRSLNGQCLNISTFKLRQPIFKRALPSNTYDSTLPHCGFQILDEGVVDKVKLFFYFLVTDENMGLCLYMSLNVVCAGTLG